jgi:hypothetical protein
MADIIDALAARQARGLLKRIRRVLLTCMRPASTGSPMELAADLAEGFVERWGRALNVAVLTTDPASTDRRFTPEAQEVFNDVYEVAERVAITDGGHR